MENNLPISLLPSLTAISEQDIACFSPFYHSVFCSYAFVNSLFFQQNSKLQLQCNLFGTTFAPRIRWQWVTAGLLTISDLPVLAGKIDFDLIASRVGSSADLYIFCCTLQKNLGKYLPENECIAAEPHELQALQAKILVAQWSDQPLSLEYWNGN